MLWRASRLRLFFCFIMTCAIVNITTHDARALTHLSMHTLQQQHMLDCNPLCMADRHTACTTLLQVLTSPQRCPIAVNNVCSYLQCLVELSALLPANVTKFSRSAHTSAMLAMRVCVSGRRYRKRPAVSNSPQAVSTLC